MKVRITNAGKPVSEDVLIADSFGDRLIGLMFKEKLHGASGLLIDPCNSIHTFFMRYSLDIVFLSRSNVVIKIIRGLKPWRLTWMYFRAAKTLELPAGDLPLEIRVGDQLEVTHV